jgi:integrase
VTEWGKPFSFKGFGNRFKEWCRAVGLPNCCTLHGVRKHTASQLAEEGATPHQIGSVTGHTSLKEIERYTAKARRNRDRSHQQAEMSGARLRTRTEIVPLFGAKKIMLSKAMIRSGAPRGIEPLFRP